MPKPTKANASVRSTRSSRFAQAPLFFAAAIVITSLTASAWAWLAPTIATEQSTPIAKVRTSVPAALRANPAQERVEVERITIRPTGFDPAEITRPQGRFILAVDNRSGLQVVSLRLASEAGHPVGEKRVPRERLDWREHIDLRPGRYVLTEANHPEWVCRIVIAAQ